MDRGAWWVTVHGVAESERLKRLSTHGGGVGSGWCISSKFPGVADASDPGTTLGAGLVPFTVIIRHIRISSAIQPHPQETLFQLDSTLGGGGTFVDLRRGSTLPSGPIPEKVRGRIYPICRVEH